MRKFLSCVFTFSICVAMLSACGTQEDTAQAEAILNSETTAAETESEPEINYQKKRLVYYPADGDSYVAEEYEYNNDGYNKKMYFSNGILFSYIEYKDDIMIKSTDYDKDGSIFIVSEYDESEFNNTIKISFYDDNQKISSENLYDYEFNDDRTEAVETMTMILYDSDTGEKMEGIGLDIKFTYIQKYDYDESGRIIYKYEYNKDTETVMYEYYYEYDDNGNEILRKDEDSVITSEYDENNNLIHRHYSRNSGDSDVYYDYDEYGRQIGWTVYDENGNETSHSVVEYE